MSVLTGAQVTIELEQLDRLRKDLLTAQTQRAVAEAVAAELALHGQGTEKLAAALRDALKVVEFAVANLPPSDAPRWPYENLRSLAQFLSQVEFDQRLKEWAISCLIGFATEAAEWEKARKEGRTRDLAARETGGRPVPAPPGEPVPVEND